MTLVAAFRASGVPTLVGDFLITGGPSTRARKKIHRLRPNLVIGWTGRQLAAEIVLTALVHGVRGERPSPGEIESILTTLPVDESLGGLEVVLVGWIIAEEPRCFLWNSAWPNELFYADRHFVGSGAARYQGIIGNSGESSPSPRPATGADLLYGLSLLMADELGIRKNRAAGFGLAYEALVFDETSSTFEYLNDVAFVFAEVLINAGGAYVGTNVMPRFFRYWHDSECAVVHTATIEARELGPWLHHEVNVITPAYDHPAAIADDILARVMAREYALPAEPSFTSLFMSPIRNADTTHAAPITPLIMIGTPQDIPRQVGLRFEPEGGFKANAVEFTVPGKSFFDWALPVILANES